MYHDGRYSFWIPRNEYYSVSFHHIEYPLNLRTIWNVLLKLKGLADLVLSGFFDSTFNFNSSWNFIKNLETCLLKLFYCILLRWFANFVWNYKRLRPTLSNISETSHRISMEFWSLLINEITKLLSFEVLKTMKKLTILESPKILVIMSAFNSKFRTFISHRKWILS